MDTYVDQDKTLKLVVFQICYFATLLSNLVIFISMPLGITIISSLASRCFILCNLTAFCYAVIHSLKCYVPYKTTQIITIVFMICFSYVSYMLFPSSGMRVYLIRLLGYLALPFSLLYIDYLNPDKIILHFTFIINFLSSLVFIFLSFTGYRFAGYETFIASGNASLTLGFNNPNQTAIYLLVTWILLLCSFCFYQKKSVRALLFADIIYIGWLLSETRSRTCILIAILLLGIILVKRQYKIPKLIVILILFLPAIFMMLYPYIYENGWMFTVNLFGKSDYSSRAYMFQSMLSWIFQKHRYWVGDYGTFLLENLHNGTLSVFCTFGIIGLTSFYIYYFRAYLNILKNGIKSKTAFIALLGLLAVFLHACAESTFLTGGSMFAGSLCPFILLVKLNRKDVQQD